MAAAWEAIYIIDGLLANASEVQPKTVRRRIAAVTNKVEGFNGFSAWLRFGNDGVIADNDPAEHPSRHRPREPRIGRPIDRRHPNPRKPLPTSANHQILTTGDQPAARFVFR
ncbi:Tn3 family transposase [Streptosporangium sp. NBC_01756]|uniref:Tn3 family transposase n=1 Tax=Streptosporangium sp. NBC_01756 TaxID=2975950 RepID=UPI002DD82E4D|nr:Tn3 family transposase [Streptosporangium sp. NBC_01756]WSC87309.1 transposase [Streptosporangium sp. NBC_01756]